MCNCGHDRNRHQFSKYVNSKKSPCDDCTCLEYVYAEVLQTGGDSLQSADERLRSVLVAKQMEKCANCKKQLNISDVRTGSKARWRYYANITCGDCGYVVIEISIPYNRFNLTEIIQVLQEH